MKLDLRHFLPILLRFRPIFFQSVPTLIQLLPMFERFVPIFASYFIEGSLKSLKAKGSIDDYRSRTIRIGRLHYRIDSRIIMTEEQTNAVLIDLSTNVVRAFRGNIDNPDRMIMTKKRAVLMIKW